MAFHHLAMATRDIKGIDHFYREVMGFDLKKVEIGPTPEGSWAKHFFYEIEPDHFIAFSDRFRRCGASSRPQKAEHYEVARLRSRKTSSNKTLFARIRDASRHCRPRRFFCAKMTCRIAA
jgi:catechol 2,3-dioxygenase-like lactoylglutathione lyase family enzyme